MAPTLETARQPQSQEVMVDLSTQQTNGVISQQPQPTETMSTESDLHLRGGGVVGDCCEAICAFEICKGCCECCC